MTVSAVFKGFSSNVFVDTAKAVDRERVELAAKQSRTNEYDSVSSLKANGVYSTYCDTVAKLGQIKTLIDSNSLVESKLNMQIGAISQLSDIINQARGEIAQYNSTSSPIYNIKESALGYLSQVVSIINTSGTNGFLFAGLNPDRQPIADINSVLNTSILVNGSVTSNYSSSLPSSGTTQIDLQRQINTNIDAGNPAFQKIIAGLQMMRDLTKADTAGRAKAMGYLDDALKGLASLVVQVGFNQRMLEDANSNLNAANQTYSLILETSFKVNILEVKAEASEVETRLTSAYSSLRDYIQRPQLADYL